MVVSLNFEGQGYQLTDAGLLFDQRPVLVDRDLHAYDPGDYLPQGVRADAWVCDAAEADPSVGLDHPLIRRFLAPAVH